MRTTTCLWATPRVRSISSCRTSSGPGARSGFNGCILPPAGATGFGLSVVGVGTVNADQFNETRLSARQVPIPCTFSCRRGGRVQQRIAGGHALGRRGFRIRTCNVLETRVRSWRLCRFAKSDRRQSKRTVDCDMPTVRTCPDRCMRFRFPNEGAPYRESKRSPARRALRHSGWTRNTVGAKQRARRQRSRSTSCCSFGF